MFDLLVSDDSLRCNHCFNIWSAFKKRYRCVYAREERIILQYMANEIINKLDRNTKCRIWHMARYELMIQYRQSVVCFFDVA